ncbi:MAG: hypothetical protein K2X86_10740 [Cytophagaceae bacterium]|nr:hypothetical protein [Cytophagaceae bacterium]
MDKNFYNPENIEAYLENKLSASQQAYFEGEIAKDPLLQNELHLQRDIIDSLKEYRKTQLKNRLNGIEVSTAPSYIGMKIAASVMVSGLIGLGVYSYFNNSDGTVKSEENQSVVINAPENIINESSGTKNEINKENTTTNTQTVIEHETSRRINNYSERTQNTETVTEIVSPVIIENMEGDPVIKDDNGNIPDGKIAQNTENKTAGISVEINRKSDKKFHYQYFDNKLFLYGDFNAKTYEIIELHPSIGGKQVYLFYDNNYYNLDANQLEATELHKITDKKLIEDLNKLNK